MPPITKTLPAWLVSWSVMCAIIAAAALISLLFGEIAGDLVLLAGLATSAYYRARRRRAARNALVARMMTRIIAALDAALAQQPYEIRSLTEWPMERLADWPDSKESPAPVAAFDLTIKTEGSEPETFTLLLDPRLLVLPVLADELPITPMRPCPFCPHGQLHHDHDGVAHQISADTTIWRCDHCNYTDRADLLGNPEPIETTHMSHLSDASGETRTPNNICRPRCPDALPVVCEISDCDQVAA